MIDILMLVDVDDEKAWPFPMTEAEFQYSNLKPIDDPYPLPSVEEGSVAEARRDEAFSTIAPLLADYGRLFEKKERNQLISELLTQIDKPRLYVTRQLRRYWQRGMAPNALAPDYHRCGGKGLPRRKIKKKPGRKRRLTRGSGVIITNEIADLFKLAVEGFFLVNDKVRLSAAKDKAVGLFKARFPNADETSIPTMAQFRYFYQTNYSNGDVFRERTPSRTYDKDMRPLVSTSGYMNFGPGDRYEIDATIADLYLVANNDPEAIIGRPVVYFVKDVFSRMVVGLYVGLENPSWVAAMIALANAFTDKVDFCRDYGIAIDASQWPSVGIPAGIMADRGELLYRQADVLVNRFGIKLSNARAYRGDDKAICERAFNTVQAQFRPYVGGIVEPVNGKKRIGRRYELDAELSLDAFTELIIKLVINHNTRHVIDGYDFAPDMPEELPAVPLELWNWGIRNRTGKLKPCDEDLVRINLLPCEYGTVSEVGIGFKGLKYTCQEALKAGWFDRIRQNRPSKVEIAFDPRRINKVYLRPDNNFETYWVCELSDRSRRFRDMSFVEAAGLLKAMRKTEGKAKQSEAFGAPDLQEEIEQLVSRERAKKKGRMEAPASERLRGIRENRRLEKESERDRARVKTKRASEKPKKSTEVVELRPVGGKRSTNLDYPDLDAFLEDADD
ncbi:Tn7 transposase protein TnsB [Syntrophotalea carbinolica DSM 2380]|uniref:Tn7 transposase protein TnsB n=1 Tax=Syntrophotalea carbinolica (strain DSM 2380 / NBRC 103641 / GraBd1) TaxID=338963 RepID=Q3A0E1_SYNC1|nr:Mu transposase C-terminal domain-containing protein [Syntrophotalea carbinolica]ABA90166.1 Tn7 transposase protein TnsB [Syntrophotalea carbinolica DSM 2380]